MSSIDTKQITQNKLIVMGSLAALVIFVVLPFNVPGHQAMACHVHCWPAKVGQTYTTHVDDGGKLVLLSCSVTSNDVHGNVALRCTE